MILEKYSMGVGDRFGRQGRAQLRAMIRAAEEGVAVTPVWNKSHREHTIIGTSPADVRSEAESAVAALSWSGPYCVDADHISLKNVDAFIEPSDFFTLDVADEIGQPAAADDVKAFVDRHARYVGSLEVPHIDEAFEIRREMIDSTARKYLAAVKEAGRIYRHVESVKGAGNFITEVSMDETDRPQTPVEVFFILAAVAAEGIPAQTMAPKFTGRSNKGVDYVGDVGQFAKEFDQDLAVIALAVREFDLSADLKLSVHSGSDKFSLYGRMREAMTRHDSGLHLKTAGTTWLEELIGLASAGGDGLRIAKDIYGAAVDRFQELCGPYAAVIDIDQAKLPSPADVDAFSGEQFAAALRHDPRCEQFNPHFRQLLHVGYKVAAEMGPRYLDALDAFEDVIARNVTENILERHVRPIFIGR